MARIRTVKPEFWTSEQIVECSTNARLLFVGLWCFCDDAGRHVASPKRLKMEVFPGDVFTPNQISAWVDELINNGLVTLYEAQGQRYWEVTGWQKHQKIDRPSVKYPGPFDEHSTIIRRTLNEGHPPESNGVESKGVERNIESVPLDVDELQKEKDLVSVWNALKGVRPNRGGCLTEGRRKTFRARLKASGWWDDAQEALGRFPLKCFEEGDNWKPDMEWFLRPDSVTKILEGKYDWRKNENHRGAVRPADKARVRQRDYSHLDHAGKAGDHTLLGAGDPDGS